MASFHDGLPGRLFAIITHAEMTMADAIRREFGGTDGWMERLSEDRQKKIRCQYDRADSHDNAVGLLLFSQFAGKVSAIKKRPLFTAGKNKFESDMQTAQKLRDKLAHANDYAASRDAAAQVCATLRMIEHWIAQLSAWPASASTAAGGH